VENQEEIQASIREVSGENIEVDVYGLRIRIEKGYLSALDIQDASRYFDVNEDLFVKVLACSEDTNYVLLSNVGNETDPKRLVDEFDKWEEAPISGRIERIRETGLIIQFPGKKLRGYLPRRFATYSRFRHLADQYSEGQNIGVQLHGFDPEHRNYVCRASELRDPWENIEKYPVGQVASGTIHQISSRYIICEMEPGLEAIIPFAEVAWGSEEEKETTLMSHNIGDIIKAKIIDIDKARKQLVLSPKRITESPVENFLRAHDGEIVKGRVSKVTQHSAILELGAERIEGYLHVSEFMWCYCSDMSKYLEISDELAVKVLCHDGIHDNIKVSVKRLNPFQFDEFVDAFNIGDTVRGTVKCIDTDRAIVYVKYGEDQYIEAYVHKSEVSNVSFVDEVLMSKILSRNEEYDFLIKRKDPRLKIVELSRKRFLTNNLENIAYGETYRARIIGSVGDKIYLHGENLEGFLLSGGLTSATPGKTISAIPARIDLGTKKIEFFVAE
jgi:ribosomal protein S1